MVAFLRNIRGIDKKVDYVLERNLNYIGAVFSWLKDDLEIIDTAGDTDELAKAANPKDSTYLIPASRGVGAPYWKSDSKAMIMV